LTSAALEAWSLNCAAPVPVSGATCNQLVVRPDSSTAAVHWGAPPVKLNASEAVAVDDAPVTDIDTAAGETEGTAAVAAGATREVDSVAVTGLPLPAVPSIS